MVFTKDLLHNEGFFVKGNTLITFKSYGRDYNNDEYIFVASTVYRYENNKLKMIYNNIKPGKSYKSSICMTTPLHEDHKICEKIGNDLIKKIQLLDILVGKDDLISLATIYAIKKNLFYDGKNCKWKDKKLSEILLR